MSFGLGTVHCKASKQRLTVKSSTEAKLVGMSNYMPYTLWIRHFLETQGYPLERNIVFQDNKSAILMETNGRNSCTGNSHHIHIRYFFVKDRIEKKEITIMHCNTELMLADFFTKTIQGALFKTFCDIIMGRVPIELPPLVETNNPPSKECAGNTNISMIDPEETPASTEGNSKMTTSGVVRKGVTFSLKTILKNNKKMRCTERTYATALRGSD